MSLSGICTAPSVLSCLYLLSIRFGMPFFAIHHAVCFSIFWEYKVCTSALPHFAQQTFFSFPAMTNWLDDFINKPMEVVHKPDRSNKATIFEYMIEHKLKITDAVVQEELEKMKEMNAEEAAAYTARVLQEAEEARREAEEAEREAEEAEAEAAALKAFAKAARAKVLRKRRSNMRLYHGRYRAVAKRSKFI